MAGASRGLERYSLAMLNVGGHKWKQTAAVSTGDGEMPASIELTPASFFLQGTPINEISTGGIFSLVP